MICFICFRAVMTKHFQLYCVICPSCYILLNPLCYFCRPVFIIRNEISNHRGFIKFVHACWFKYPLVNYDVIVDNTTRGCSKNVWSPPLNLHPSPYWLLILFGTACWFINNVSFVALNKICRESFVSSFAEIKASCCHSYCIAL